MNNKQRTIQKNNKHTIGKTMTTILKTIYMNNGLNNMKTIFPTITRQYENNSNNVYKQYTKTI